MVAQTKREPSPNRLREWRELNDATMRDVAALCGLSESAISLIERRLREPSALVKIRIARALGVQVATIFPFHGEES